MQANADHTWDQMKQQLATRFSDVTDAQMALSLLRQVRQKQGETIQNSAERILSLAEDAYDNQGGTRLRGNSLIFLSMDNRMIN